MSRDFGGFDWGSAVEVELDPNTVMVDDKIIQMPQTLNASETKFLAQKVQKPDSNYFAMEDVGGLEGLVRGVRQLAEVQIPMAASSLLQEAATFAGKRKDLDYLKEEYKDYGKLALANPAIGGFKFILNDLPSQAISGFVQMIGEDKVFGYAKSLSERTMRHMEEADLKQPELEGLGRFMYDLGSGGGSVLASIGIGLVTKSPKTSSTFFGALQKAQIYQESIEKGLTPEEASNISTLAGGVEGALEFVGLGAFLKGLKGSSIVGRFLTGAVTESLQEGTQTTAENVITEVAKVRDRSMGEIVSDVAYSAFLGGIIGGPTSAVAGTFFKEKGLTEEQSERLSKYVEKNIPSMDAVISEVFAKELAPLSDDTEQSKQAIDIMKKFISGEEIVNTKALTPEKLAEFEATVAQIREIVGDVSTSEVRRDWIKQATDAGIDQEEAEATSDIMEARALAASKALGVSPKEWYDSQKIEIKRELPPDIKEMRDLAQMDRDYFNSAEFKQAQPDFTNPDEMFQRMSRREEIDFRIGQLSNIEGQLDNAIDANDKPQIGKLSAQKRIAEKRIKELEGMKDELYQGKRGKVSFLEDGRKVITLLKDANKSTLLHEMSHIFLRDFASVAQNTTNQSVKEDFETIKEWLGAGDDFTRQQEETFARGFEQYMREGVAPTGKLQKAFDRFRKWLQNIYKQASDLNVELNDDVRRVFDRMLSGENGGLGKLTNEFQKVSELEQKEFSTSEYEKVRTREKGSTLRQDVENVLGDLAEQIADTFVPVSTRLGSIGEELKNAVRTYAFNIGFYSMEDSAVVKPFLDGVSKMSKEDYREFDLALKNVDSQRVDYLIRKYKLLKEYEKARGVLDKLWEEARSVGLEIEKIEEYWPRSVNKKDAHKFVTFLRGQEGWSAIETFLKKIDPDGKLSEDERAEEVNDFLRGYGYDKVGLARPDILKKRQDVSKKRTIAFITAEMNDYYIDSSQALIQYINQMRRAIETRRFLGKGSVDRDRAAEAVIKAQEKLEEIKNDWNAKIAEAKNDVKREELTKQRDHIIKKQEERIEEKKNAYLDTAPPNIEESIGAYVLKLIEQGVVTHKEEASLKKIIQSVVDAKGTHGIVSAMKNTTYIYTMGQISSAVTQIQDLAFSLYKNGVFDTGYGLYKTYAGGLSKSDLGVENILQEFQDETRLAKAVKWTFDAVGIRLVDDMGKGTLINGALNKFSRNAKKGDARFLAQLKAVFGEKAEQVRQDLIDKKATQNVKYLLFCELSDTQPISLAEMPVNYNRGGNLRIFYMLKTYTVKLLDLYRRDVFTMMRKDPKQAMTNLVRLSTYLMLMGVSADALKDWMLGRQVELDDLVIDNLIKLTGITKYQIYKSKEDGIINTFWQTLFVPPVGAPVDDLFKDVSKTAQGKRDIEDWQTLGRVPILGKFYYWWFGGGEEKTNKEKENKGKRS